MDVTDLLGNNLTLEVVRSCNKREFVILSAGSMKTMQDGKVKPNFLIEFNGKQINWLPNRISLKNIASKHGTETQTWIGKPITIEIGNINGKDCIIAKA